MAPHAGTYALGPASASLRIHTGKEGKAARAGHNLEIEVGDWAATVELGDRPEDAQLSLTVNSRSLRVLAGSGGMQALDDDAKQNITTTIDAEVLEGGEISFRANHVHALEEQGDADVQGEQLHVHGELNLLGTTGPVAFTLTLGDDGSVASEAVIAQSDFGIKPYSALFGTLKVKDELRVTVAGRLSPA